MPRSLFFITRIAKAGSKVADLPAAPPLNHHWTKGLIASRDGSRLYVSVGSNSNVGENGLDVEERRAAILEIDPTNGQSRVFASGLRNPVGMSLSECRSSRRPARCGRW